MADTEEKYMEEEKEDKDEVEGEKGEDVDVSKIFHVVAELHRRGYQRIRIFPLLSSSGSYWRCNLVPLDNISPMTHSFPIEYEDALCYSTSERAKFLGGLGNLNTDTAETIVDAMLNSIDPEYPEDVLTRAKGEDRDYAAWFTDEFLAKLPGGALPCLVMPEGDCDPYHFNLLGEEHKHVKIKLPPVRIDNEEAKPIASILGAAKARAWPKVFKLLEKNDCVISECNPYSKSGFTLLHHAAWWGDVEPAKKLIAMGAEVMKPDAKEMTPRELYISRHHKNPTLLALLKLAEEEASKEDENCCIS